MPDGPRYDDDFYAWTQYQADVLRSMRTRDNRLDREHLAEEIEDLGKSERHTVESQITRIIEHFLKIAYSPADRPRYGWMASVADARRVLRQKLTSTLRHHAEGVLVELYADGREAAELGLREYGEHGAAVVLPSTCPYTLDQVLSRTWYPEPSRGNR